MLHVTFLRGRSSSESLIVVLSKGIFHACMEIRVTLLMKWQSILISLQDNCYSTVETVIFIISRERSRGILLLLL